MEPRSLIHHMAKKRQKLKTESAFMGLRNNRLRTSRQTAWVRVGYRLERLPKMACKLC